MRALLILAMTLFVSAGLAAQPDAGAPAKRTFRVIFTAWDGDPQRPETITVSLNTLDLRQPFCLPTLGERVPNTKLKLHKFESKSRNVENGQTVDASELTLINIETQQTATLVLGHTQDISAIAGPPWSP
jgi:hypothetical protein